jgi:hypothetical protein
MTPQRYKVSARLPPSGVGDVTNRLREASAPTKNDFFGWSTIKASLKVEASTEYSSLTTFLIT